MRLIFPSVRVLTALLLPAGTSLAGSYAPAAGQPGSTAIHRSDPRFLAWARRVASYQPGTEVSPAWQNPSRCLGPATDDPEDITCLGSGGSITLTFPGFIRDGLGPDFVVFENSFSDTFIEHAWVEVSADGIHFTRFPNHSLTENPVGTFGSIDPTNVSGLAGKYRQPWGEPFDLAEIGMDQVSHVRLVDVVGDGSARDSENRVIYDPWPVTGSAGFDLNAVGVLHLRQWQTFTVGTLNGAGVNATALAHLPDGRFLLGLQGVLSVQSAWGKPGLTPVGDGGVEFDPSFIAIGGEDLALVGSGGGFGTAGGVHRLNPSLTSPSLESAPLAALPNYSGIGWQNETGGKAGWIIGGTSGPQNQHALSWIAADGSLSGVFSEPLSTYSSGLAADRSGRLYAALYELPGSPAEAESEWVLRFDSAAVNSGIEHLVSGGSPLRKEDGVRVFRFDSASSLAVDGRERIWGSGFSVRHLQVYDPATGASRRVVPDHDPLPGVTDVLYQVSTFTRDGEPWVAFLAGEESGTPGTPVLYGIAPADALTVPESYESWSRFFFDPDRLNPDSESSYWGPGADPDQDGLVNLMEYALGTLPLDSGPSPAVAGRAGGRLTLNFPRLPLRTGLTLDVEAAADPAGPWEPIARSSQGGPMAAVDPANPVIGESGTADAVSVTVRDTVSSMAVPHRFLRLRVSPMP